MAANFDSQSNNNTEDINNRKNKESTSNEAQILETEEQRKNKSLADYPLMDHKRSAQTEDSEWNLMANNKRKNIQRPLMEHLYN